MGLSGWNGLKKYSGIEGIVSIPISKAWTGLPKPKAKNAI